MQCGVCSHRCVHSLCSAVSVLIDMSIHYAVRSVLIDMSIHYAVRCPFHKSIYTVKCPFPQMSIHHTVKCPFPQMSIHYTVKCPFPQMSIHYTVKCLFPHMYIHYTVKCLFPQMSINYTVRCLFPQMCSCIMQWSVCSHRCVHALCSEVSVPTDVFMHYTVRCLFPQMSIHHTVRCLFPHMCSFIMQWHVCSLNKRFASTCIVHGGRGVHGHFFLEFNGFLSYILSSVFFQCIICHTSCLNIFIHLYFELTIFVLQTHFLSFFLLHKIIFFSHDIFMALPYNTMLSLKCLNAWPESLMCSKGWTAGWSWHLVAISLDTMLATSSSWSDTPFSVMARVGWHHWAINTAPGNQTM